MVQNHTDQMPLHSRSSLISIKLKAIRIPLKKTRAIRVVKNLTARIIASFILSWVNKASHGNSRVVRTSQGQPLKLQTNASVFKISYGSQFSDEKNGLLICFLVVEIFNKLGGSLLFVLLQIILLAIILLPIIINTNDNTINHDYYQYYYFQSSLLPIVLLPIIITINIITTNLY